jgi:hypothetical protein
MPGRDGTGPTMVGCFGFRNTNAIISSRRLFAHCRFTCDDRPLGCRYNSTKEALAAEKALLERRLAQIK